ncbi:MAG: phosphoribosylglycinamide formyltransferase [Treponemataceae bacterium]
MSVNAPHSVEKPVRLLVLVSGGGTNLQALIDAEKEGTLGVSVARREEKVPGPLARIVGVISDRPDVYALERAKIAEIPVWTEAPNKALPGDDRREELSARILVHAKALNVDLIILAGFLSILKGPIVETYAGRMMNLHPALLPKYGGAGMYGDKVHAAVLAAKEIESGCTVHLVDSGTDTGPIILQRRVPVFPSDTPETLAKRIHTEEHKAIVEAVAILIR